MPVLNVTPEEFSEIVLIYLLDKINNDDSVYSKEHEFEEVIKKLKFIKPKLVNFYLQSPMKTKIGYKYIRDVFLKESLNKTSILRIYNDTLDENESFEEKKSLNENDIKSIVKSTIKKAREIKSKYNKTITEDILDKIIEKIMEKRNL
jgi:hypothetical protein